jgi:hypothetical protein
VDRTDEIIAIKTRLTTIKGYAQLLERELVRAESAPRHIVRHAARLRQEIDRLVALIRELENSLTEGRGLAPRAGDEEDSGQASSRR